MKQHKCHPQDTCTCYILGLEPEEDCPIHSGYTSNRCCECGRFLKIKEMFPDLGHDARSEADYNSVGGSDF